MGIKQMATIDKTSFLVSETDEKGIITFANDDFCEIAGYNVNELIGKNHNIVRHQDMPKVAFKELWDTVKTGKAWSGFVKNKTKNGDSYWVYATVYPIIGQGGKQRYISCRKIAHEDEIDRATKLYKSLKTVE
ncbi:MAG: PAS domain-containing protein [Campylobacterales bacterium]|nr:PAS domain-containing protein [Campylobacterales bacterium]